MMGDALEPCPWCEPLKMQLIGQPRVSGYGLEHKDGGTTHWHGFCVACGAEGPKEQTPEAAAAAWNRRALKAGRSWKRRNAMLTFKEIHAIERMKLDGWNVTLEDVIIAARHRHEGGARRWIEALEDAVKRRGAEARR